MPSVQLLVTIELRKESGKFAGREELVEAITQALEEAAGQDVDGVGADGDSTYVVEDCLVEEYVPPKKAKP